MGAQYSTGTVSADWKGWLEERCSLEHVRAIYNEFRALVSSRRDDDGFFINYRDFLKVHYCTITCSANMSSTVCGVIASSIDSRC